MTQFATEGVFAAPGNVDIFTPRAVELAGQYQIAPPLGQNTKSPPKLSEDQTRSVEPALLIL